MNIPGMFEKPGRRNVRIVDTHPFAESANMRFVPDVAAEVVEISLQIVGLGESRIAAGYMARWE